ncbi:MAG: hypothetical protein ACQESR_26750 [Planctomycetota bacterium]
MESCSTQPVLPLVGLAAEKVIRDRYNPRGPRADAADAVPNLPTEHAPTHCVFFGSRGACAVARNDPPYLCQY